MCRRVWGKSGRFCYAVWPSCTLWRGGGLGAWEGGGADSEYGTCTVEKNLDDSPAIIGIPRYFQINLDWFPEVFGCSSITRNAIQQYPLVLLHINVLSSTVFRSKVACNPFIVGQLSEYLRAPPLAPLGPKGSFHLRCNQKHEGYPLCIPWSQERFPLFRCIP